MPASSIGAEISQLTRNGPSKGPQKGKPFPRRQAIAASLSMARRGDFGRSAKRKASRRSL